MHIANHMVRTYILVRITYILAAGSAAGGAATAATAATVVNHSIWSMEVIHMHFYNNE